MCEYCDGRECIGSIAGLNYVRDTYVYIGECKGKPALVVEQDCGSVSVVTHQEINACPMCGRELRGDAE